VKTTFSTFWRSKGLTDDATSIDEMIAALEAAIVDLRAMRDAGVRVEGSVTDDYAYLITTDPAVAEQFGFHPDEDDDEGFEDGEPSPNGYYPE
jgi:hypothetical protein